MDATAQVKWQFELQQIQFESFKCARFVKVSRTDGGKSEGTLWFSYQWCQRLKFADLDLTLTFPPQASHQPQVHLGPSPV